MTKLSEVVDTDRSIDIIVDHFDKFLTLLDNIADAPKGNNMLSKKDILLAKDIKTEKVSVPEWGGDVLVRGLTGAERDEFEGSIVQIEGKKQTMDMGNIRARLCAMSMVDEQGVRIFDEEDVDELGKKSASALQRIFEVTQRLSGLTTEDVENLAKNLSQGPVGGSGSV